MSLPPTPVDSLIELPPGYTVDAETGAWMSLPWPGDPALPFGHPERLELLPPSLGPSMIGWAQRWLVHPLTGRPWRFTPGQARFMHLWWAVDPDTGRWLYRTGTKRGAKGTGKDPFGAALVWCAAAGPRQIVDVDGGRIVAKPLRRALVQVGANSQDQAKKLLMVANAMVSDRMKLAYRVDSGLTRTVFGDGSRIELLKASEKSQEGDPATDIVLNEVHHMTKSNGGQALEDVARRNVAKSPALVSARVLELTNAHQQGQESVGEGAYTSWQDQVAGRTYLQDILYDSIEAPPGLSLYDQDDIMAGLRAAYMDAPWADLPRLRAEILDARTSEAQTIRYYFNGLATAEDAWVEPRAFDDLARPEWIVEDGDQIALFLDCSKSGDATALSGCRLSDGHVMSLGCWQPRHGEQHEGWLAPREEVDATVREAFARWRVVWCGIDPSPAEDDETAHSYWMPTIDGIHRDFGRRLKVWATPGAGGHSVLFDMRLSSRGARERNRLFTEAAMQTAQDIDEDGSLTHDGDPMLRRHVHNARRRPNQWGITVGKVNRSSRHLIDYSVTMIGARMGRRLALNSPKVRQQQTQRKAVIL